MTREQREGKKELKEKKRKIESEETHVCNFTC